MTQRTRPPRLTAEQARSLVTYVSGADPGVEAIGAAARERLSAAQVGSLFVVVRDGAPLLWNGQAVNRTTAAIVLYGAVGRCVGAADGEHSLQERPPVRGSRRSGRTADPPKYECRRCHADGEIIASVQGWIEANPQWEL